MQESSNTITNPKSKGTIQRLLRQIYYVNHTHSCSTNLLANAKMVAELWCLVSQQILQHPLISLRAKQGLTVVVSRQYVMDDGYDTPKGISFFEEEQSDGRQSVKTLAVANVLIVPTECHQHSTKLVDLAKERVVQ